MPGQPSQVVQIILLVTVLGVAPAVLLMCTAFTKIVVVLSLVRSAIGTQSVPPNQVLVGLALFLSLFVMGPTFDAMQSQGVGPYTKGTKTIEQAYTDGVKPLRAFMLAHTRSEEIALMTKASGDAAPKTKDDVDLRTLVPAFVLSELRAAFIIGFVVFVPFLVVDIVVSAVLMSLGMVMLPPSLISLPFKLLLFVLVDGWSLVVTTLLRELPMNDKVVQIVAEALITATKIAGPVLVGTLVIGLVLSIVQSATQVQETDADVPAEALRRRARARAHGRLGAAHARGLHPRPLHPRPVPDQLVRTRRG